MNPADDAVGVVASDFAGVRVENIGTIELHADLVTGRGLNFDVGFSKDHNEIAFAGVFQLGGHAEVGVAGLLGWDAAEFGEFRSGGVVVEGAGDEDVEAGFGGFPDLPPPGQGG